MNIVFSFQSNEGLQFLRQAPMLALRNLVFTHKLHFLSVSIQPPPLREQGPARDETHYRIQEQLLEGPNQHFFGGRAKLRKKLQKNIVLF